MSVATTLGKAADLIDERGLAIGDWTVGERVCAVQALWMAAGATGHPTLIDRAVRESRATPAQVDAYRDSMIVLQTHLGLDSSSVASWSDRTGQTMVVRTLRRLVTEIQAERDRLHLDDLR
jgi:hypothetical protein